MEKNRDLPIRDFGKIELEPNPIKFKAQEAQLYFNSNIFKLE
jgi:hypothetical protein